MKKLLTILTIILPIILSSCTPNSGGKTINEVSIVQSVEINKTRKYKQKYWVVTDDFNFYTDQPYRPGDTVRLINFGN